jgi:hypothetical protein
MKDYKLVYQTEVFPEDYDVLHSEFDIITCESSIDGPIFSQEVSGPFLFRGSIPIGRRITKTMPRAITWLYDKVYDCNKYLPQLGLNALNNPHMFCEAGTFHLLIQSIKYDNIFIKDNNGYKSMSGGKYEDIKYDLPILFPEELILMAPLKEIVAEWRFVISDMVILTGSPYPPTIEEVTPEIEKFAETVLADLQEPAPMWTLDICRLKNGSLKVVEINSLLSAGWYDCDRQKIVSELKRQVSLISV